MYQNCNLREWPFRTVADENFAPIWAGRAKTKTQIDRLLRRMELFPKSGLHILWANFGMGKTHTLYHIKYRCLQTKGMLVPVYTVMPKRSTGFIELYREIVQSLPYEYLRRQLHEVSHNYKGNVALHPMFQRSPGVVRALLAIDPEDTESSAAAMQWLAAQPGLSKHEMSLIDVTYRIKTPEDAINALDALVKLATFGSANKKIVILIDEYQRIGELRPKIMTENNASLHTLFNANPTRLELILSFSFGNKDNVDYMLSSELKSRAELQSISLDVLSPDEALEFMRDLLAQFRLKEDSRWAYPFTPDALVSLIRYIAEKKKKAITPRRLMLYADYVLSNYLLDRDPDSNGIRFDEFKSYLDDPDLGASDVDAPE
jgi:hypothetical protein